MSNPQFFPQPKFAAKDRYASAIRHAQSSLGVDLQARVGVEPADHGYLKTCFTFSPRKTGEHEMDNAMRELILTTSDSYLVWGKDECFQLLPLDDGEPADMAVIKEAISRGFASCGTLGSRRGSPGSTSRARPRSRVRGTLRELRPLYKSISSEAKWGCSRTSGASTFAFSSGCLPLWRGSWCPPM